MYPSTWNQLATQWANPADVSTVLMIIGGDVVQTALAQSTGTLFTPVCFSFGWVAYAFIALIAVIGDGRLLPAPDYAVKVFNLNSGYVRENKNWVIGRIVRDHEAKISKEFRCDKGIRITIYDAKPNKNTWTKFSYDWTHAFGLFWMLVQLGIALIPAGTDGDWTILLVTGVGSGLALTHGALPQWTAEKLPNRQHADCVFALTTGNGSKDIMIIKGHCHCLNLEEFAVPDTPRNSRPWEKFSKYKPSLTGFSGRPLTRTSSGIFSYRTRELLGIPLGFWITLLATVSQTVVWMALLITVACVRTETWYLLLIGFIGMFQNGIIAAIERPPNSRNLPISMSTDGTVAKHGVIIRNKVMDALMDLTEELGNMEYVKPLCREFFPGELRPAEHQWWQGNKTEYEDQRIVEKNIRGIPAGQRIAAHAGIAKGGDDQQSPRGPLNSSAKPAANHQGNDRTRRVSFPSDVDKEAERPEAQNVLSGTIKESEHDLEYGLSRVNSRKTHG